MSARILLQATVPSNCGQAFELANGQHLRVAATTIVDFVAFNRHDFRERFDQARTKTTTARSGSAPATC